MIKTSAIISVFLFFSGLLFSQQVMNIRSEKESNGYNIIYDLTGNSFYDINAYYSLDGGNTWNQPAGQLSGAAGPAQRPGFNKKIRWTVTPGEEKPGVTVDFKVEAITGSFTSEAGTFTDPRDGNNYKWFKIGQQSWMAENLNYSTFPGSWCYENLGPDCDVYGRLYDWKTAMEVCPAGWHLPTDSEWLLLTDFLGGENECGGKLKEKGNLHWSPPNTGATDTIGFSALPAGYRSPNGYFFNLGNLTYFWSSTEVNETRAWKRVLYFNNDNMSHLSYGKDHGFSVRCIKN